jgi:hypothetical protein
MKMYFTRQFYFNLENQEIFSSWNSNKENEKNVKIGYPLQYKQNNYIIQDGYIGRILRGQFKKYYKINKEGIEKV